ncbi:MAG: cysteine desulfurase [Clostridia bacterium]|nr:cysteine desulfurase [Clostridiales bacterium]MBQ3506499.1 cysteine desulfurase [Clostridia bacterium]
MLYFDNAATTKPSETAFSRARAFALEQFYNPSALYNEGYALQSELKKARSALLSKVADESAFELVFTSCGTESDNQAIFGFAKRGNAVTTAGEHSAVSAPFAELKNRGVIEPRIAPLQKDGRVDVSALLALVDEKTSFVSVMHVNNEVGAINDINAIAKAVKAKNPRVIFHSDGVQAYGKIPVRLSKDVDLYSISAHKIGGLKGVGALIKRKSLVLPPYLIGGGQESGRRSGTENVFGIMQFAYAAEEKFSTLKADFERLTTLRERLWEGLDKSVYTRISAMDGTPYILSVSAVGLRGEVLLHMANDKGLIVGTGSACSSNAKSRYSKIVLACGYDEKTADGTLRLSFSPTTTLEEVQKAVTILNEIGQDLTRRMK